jgi:hypothetical protein
MVQEWIFSSMHTATISPRQAHSGDTVTEAMKATVKSR